MIPRVGPVWAGRDARSALRESCYRESLGVADGLGAASVAFPAVSAGIYGWPMDDAARIAVETVRAAHTGVVLVRFVLFGDDAYRAFAIGVLRIEDGGIAEMVAFHEPAMFPAFGLPATSVGPG